MKFGSVEHPENIDFTLPKDHKDKSLSNRLCSIWHNLHEMQIKTLNF
jgi:hypothetical protein